VKIVDVCEFYSERGGGVRTYVNAKLRAGGAHGHEVVVIAPGPRDEEEERESGRIVWIGGPPLPPDPRYYVLYRERAVHEALDRERPDVVEGSSPWSGGWFAARWRGEAVKAFIFHQDPVAVYAQTFFGRRFGPTRVDRAAAPYWSYLRRLSSRFDATVVSGEWLAERLRSVGIGNAAAVPFGIDKAVFSPARRSAAIRRSLLARAGLSEDADLLVGVSRHHPEKRIGTLIEAIRRANAERPVALVLYGDGPLRSWVARRARKVKEVVIAGFTRDREELADVLASADGFLHGSSAETYGLVVAEALVSGTPLVVPDAGGAAELARPSYAETYEAGDPAACAAAIVRLLARDRSELRAAARSGGDRVATMDDHFAGLFAFYERLRRTTPTR
jgi:alpha-1,6-mannosyltransferase